MVLFLRGHYQLNCIKLLKLSTNRDYMISKTKPGTSVWSFIKTKDLDNTWRIDGMKFSPSSSQCHAKYCLYVKMNDLSAKIRATMPKSSRKFHKPILSISECLSCVSLWLKQGTTTLSQSSSSSSWTCLFWKSCIYVKPLINQTETRSQTWVPWTSVHGIPCNTLI